MSTFPPVKISDNLVHLFPTTIKVKVHGIAMVVKTSDLKSIDNQLYLTTCDSSGKMIKVLAIPVK